MSVDFRVVDGPGFAIEASKLLLAAWPAPSLYYSPQYVQWQLGFPGPCPAPAAAAFYGAKAVGVAATIHRRLCAGGIHHDVLLVSFVAVDPAYRNQGIAHGLYQTLLQAVQSTGLPVVTFGRVGSAGQRAIERAYPQAGVPLHEFGSYTPHATMLRSLSLPDAKEWLVSEDIPVEKPLLDPSATAYSAPTPRQFEHYRCDPRPRRLLMHRDESVWAWATQIEYVPASGLGNGLDIVTTLECIGMANPNQLPGLASAAAQLWPSKTTLIHAPNVSGFDAAALRKAGFRGTTAPWVGYWGGLEAPPSSNANIEII